MKYIREWFRRRWLRREARRWLGANEGQVIAARVMFALNRYARGLDRDDRLRKIIYELKNRLVRYFYEQRLCQSVALQIQEFACWSCDGTGEYWTGATCWKCDGSGIYRINQLYKFVFVIGGRRYVWHQPKALVNWPVQVTWDGQVEYRPGYGVSEDLSQVLAWLYILVVHEYLKSVGVVVPRWGLRAAIKKDWRRSWLYFRWRDLQDEGRLYWGNVRRLGVFLRTGEMPPVEEEIPF